MDSKAKELMVLEMTLNGQKVKIKTDPTKRLVDFLRKELKLTGAKEGCGVGVCGACTVLLNGEPVNSCMVMVGQVRDSTILTIEGVAQEGKPHPVQVAFLEKHAVQCGFCSPGLILTAVALLEAKPQPTREEIREAISGNLCRCTGYNAIIEAIEYAGKLMQKG